jgi:hypothetical protein
VEQVLVEVAVPIKVAAERLALLEQPAMHIVLRCGPCTALSPTALSPTALSPTALSPTALRLVEPEARRAAELQHGLHLGGEVLRGECALDQEDELQLAYRCREHRTQLTRLMHAHLVKGSELGVGVAVGVRLGVAHASYARAP